MEYAHLSEINAQPGMKSQENALHAMEDMSLTTDNVSSIQTPSVDSPMLSAEHGQEKNVLTVLQELISTPLESVLPSVINAKPGIPLMDSVLPVMLDIHSTTELVKNLLSFLLLMLDARPGTQPKTYVLPAPTDSTLTAKNVNLSQISAANGTSQDNVLFAMMVTILLSVLVTFLKEIINLLMKDVELGTGKTKDVCNAQITGSSMDSENVFLFLINAKPSIDLEIVSHAMRVTTSSWEDASLLLLRNLKMKVAEPGIGKTENALLAQITGFSMGLENVFPFQTNAKLSTHQEIVFLVMKDTTLKTEPVFLLQSKNLKM